MWPGAGRISEGSCGLMDKALVLGTKDCKFESCQDHLEDPFPIAVPVRTSDLQVNSLTRYGGSVEKGGLSRELNPGPLAP